MSTTQPNPTQPTTTEAGNGPADARIDAATLAGRLQSGDDLRILDVRSPAEFEAVHIPGAYNVPVDQLGEHAAELERHLDVPVVLVCRSGMRAGRAGETLAGVGMANMVILEGGMQAWDDGSRPVRRGRQRWDIERQVRLVAGSLVLAAIVGSLFVPELKFLAGAVGAGLTFAALSNTCMMGNLLGRLPYNRGAATCDVSAVVRELTTRR
jgi:rhodanese-related sulfurtransferase